MADLQLLAEALFPDGNVCHLCSSGLQHGGIVCHRCQTDLCTLRLPPERTLSSVRHAPLDGCVSAFPHRDEARRAVHLIKYGYDDAAAALLAWPMACALTHAPFFSRIDAVVPVPLHPSRLESRGYNQALLLAQSVCRHCSLPLAQNLLVRIANTDTQLARSRTQRLAAMQHAFAVPDPASVRGKRLLLVDDVMTTGATAMSCAQTLKAAGAKSVFLLTACRR